MAMDNKRVVGIFVGGVLLLLVAFWAGLTVTRDRKEDKPKSAVATKTPAQSSPSSESNGNSRFIVRVATFGTSQEANQLTQELLQKRYISAYTQGPNPDVNDTLYHVNIGPYDTKSAAEQVQQELAAEGRKGVTIIEQGRK